MQAYIDMGDGLLSQEFTRVLIGQLAIMAYHPPTMVNWLFPYFQDSSLY